MAFAMLEKYIQRQAYQGEVQWLVADDYRTPTPMTMGQEVVRVSPYWSPPNNSQHRNLLELIPLVRHEKVLMIEDDDWYGPGYIDVMDRLLDDADLAGVAFAHYYNVRDRLYRIHKNCHHASLCETAMNAKVLPLLEEVCRERRPWIDIALWASWKGAKRLIRPPSPIISVGIKGMPGRPGAGKGHNPSNAMNFKKDPGFSILESWTGEDAGLYRSYGEDNHGRAAT